MSNTIKTTVLLAALTALIVWIGQMLGGGQGAMIALVFAAVMNIGSYWFSDRIVIAMYRGQEIRQEDDPELYATALRARRMHSFMRAAPTPRPRAAGATASKRTSGHVRVRVVPPGFSIEVPAG